MLAEQGQLPEKHKEAMQSVTGQSNDTEHTCIGGASRGKSEKAGRKAGSVQSIENRGFYETKEEKRQFICESFVRNENWSSSRSNPVQIPRETVEPRSEGEFARSDRHVVKARSDRTFSEPLGVASGTHEEEGTTDEMGHWSERIE